MGILHFTSDVVTARIMAIAGACVHAKIAKERIMKNTRWLWAIFLIGVLAVQISFSGCGSSSDEDSDSTTSDSGTTTTAEATSTDAEQSAEATSATVATLLSTVLGGSSSSLSAPTLLYASSSPEITVTPTSSCPEYSYTTPSGASATIYGTDLSSDGSGSCTVAVDLYNDTFQEGTTAVLSCDSFSGGSATSYVTIDGELGFGFNSIETSADGDSFGFTVGVYSRDLLFSFIENGATKLCSVVLRLYENDSITVGTDSVRVDSEMSGCLSVCDSPFSVSLDNVQTFAF